MSVEKLKQVKILFDVLNDQNELLEKESLWAVKVENGYQIDNIPFYVKEIACGDIVKVNSHKDGGLHFKELFEASGHSTVRLWFAEESNVQNIRQVLRNMGCSSELDLSRLVAVDIRPYVPYKNIRCYLDKHEELGLFEYEEACLGQ